MFTTPRQKVWFVIVSLLISGLIVWAFESDSPPSIAQFIWGPYSLAWIIAISIFGGIHGASSWAVLPATLIAVFAQNLLLFSFGNWLIKRLRSLLKRDEGTSNV